MASRYAHGHELGQALCDVLGIDAKHCTEIKVSIEAKPGRVAIAVCSFFLEDDEVHKLVELFQSVSFERIDVSETVERREHDES